MNTTKENHKERFRGVWIPAEIWELLDDGTISFHDYKLLRLVDSLVNAKGVGCWASNDWLGNKLGRAAVYISSMVKKLKGLGLLRDVGWLMMGSQRHRILETCWSRILAFGDRGPQEEEIKRQMKQEFGLNVVVHLHNVKSLKDANGEVGPESRLKKNLKAGPKSPKEKSLPSNHTQTMSEYGEDLRKGGATPPTPSSNGHGDSRQASANDHFVNRMSRKATKDIPDFCFDWGDRALAILRSKVPKVVIDPLTRVNRAEHFYQLWVDLDRDTAKIEDFLVRLAKNIHRIDRPTIGSVRQLVKRFNWILDQLDHFDDLEFGPKKTETITEVEHIDLGNGRWRSRPVTRQVTRRVKEDRT